MSDPIADTLVTAVQAEADKRGLGALPVDQAYAIVRAAMALITGKLDETAKAHASAAGDAAAAKVVDMTTAENAAKGRE